jgi:acyl dehydratase
MNILDRVAAERLYWEDLAVGMGFQTPGRTITEADVVGFAGLTADFNRLHVDKDFAESTPFGQRVAHGLLVASISVGLTTRSLMHQLMEQTQIAVMENRIRFLRPTFIGDTVRVMVEVAERRETRNAERGVTVFRRSTLNQNNEAVIESTVVYLMIRRSPE